MRLSLLLLPLYLTALAVVPCQGTTTGPVGEVSAACATDVPGQHGDHGEEHPDHCTPFCSCACCGATLAAPPAIVAPAFPALPPPGNTQPRFARNWQSVAFAQGSWQPPRA